MTIRESGVLAGICWVMAFWSLSFAINTVLVAHRLTSPQWTALMTVPGGKWFWAILFGAAALILATGVRRTIYKLRAIGLALIGMGCLGIGLFYIVAPMFHLGPITLGYWPWFLGVAIGLLGAVANWRPIQWF